MILDAQAHSHAKLRWARRLARSRAKARQVGVDYALTLAYDGRAFAGYARQPGRTTVEGHLREVLGSHVPGLRRMAVAGRTDRGVSASGQVVSFRSDQPVDLNRLRTAIDARAPDRMGCLSLTRVPRGFHAQFWALERRYRYFLPLSEIAAVSRVSAMDEMLHQLVGRRSFAAFARDLPAGYSTVRSLRVARCRVAQLDSSSVLCFEFFSDGFLRRMVRVLVATALREAHAHADTDTLLRIAETEDRTRTAAPAPPEPLVLTRVIYGAAAP